MNVPLVDLSKLKSLFEVMNGHVAYVFGAKPTLDADSHTIRGSDCSGLADYLIAKCTDPSLRLPGYSQDIREWCETHNVHRLAHYSDVQYATTKRLFVCFIKPNTNGCGNVGHVFFVTKFDDSQPAVTIECYGGHGVGSRPWTAHVLEDETYEAFELPTL